MTINISELIPILIIFQSLLFALVLLTDNGPKKNSNRYLASFLILLGTQFIVIVGESFGYKSNLIFAAKDYLRKFKYPFFEHFDVFRAYIFTSG